jgi:OmcA/MtrC family decaheme c-type cytochrome
VASGTARVVSIGQIKENKLVAKSAADPRSEVVPTEIVNTVAQHTYKDVALTGTLQPRRQVVSNDKCNVCHGALGTTSGSNTLANAFHGGARNTVEACVICHDPNRASSTFMTSNQVEAGLPLSESYQFKRMIHGIHGNSKRTFPFTHGNPVTGAAFDKDGVLLADGVFPVDYKIRNFAPVVVPAGTTVAKGKTFADIAALINANATSLGYTGDPVTIENYAAEVAYPQVGLNCNTCHDNNSYQSDAGTLGAVVMKPAGVDDPNGWKVISPKAASCTGCHDSTAAQGHVTSFGGASYANKTQGEIAALPQETCNDCHSPGGFKGVDIVHGLK